MHRTATIACLLAALTASCGGENGTGHGSSEGASLYAKLGCAICHGQDGAGTGFGPTLQGKKGFWTQEKLVQYLKAPAATTQKDPRLSEQARRFTMPMAAFDKQTPEELAAIADYVLAMP